MTAARLLALVIGPFLLDAAGDHSVTLCISGGSNHRGVRPGDHALPDPAQAGHAPGSKARATFELGL